jgi:GNAT superfamily N-acetyltransferase
VQVEQVLAWVTLPLRQQVLRPKSTLAALQLPDDDAPETAHFAAYDSEHRVVGTGNVRRQPAPWGAPGWRLRGMATAPDMRGQGIGAAILERIVEHVARLGGGLLWANARIPAQRFYERAGFVTRGERWDDPEIGPHIVIERQVDPI